MRYLFVFAMLFSVALSAADTAKGTITAGVLNVRVRPSAKSDAILQLKRGDEVVVLEKGAEWVAIRPPENSSLYVSSPLISDGKLKSAANLRSGPGVNFQSLGILPKGTAVTVLADKNSWSRIGVPEVAVKCYIAAKYVKIEEVKAAAKAEESKTAEAEVRKPVVRKGDILSFNNDNFRKLQKDYLKGSARKITVEGMLKTSSNSTYGTTYILCADKKNYHVAGVIPAGIDISKKVEISGISNIVPGWSSPVLEIKKISQK